MKTKHVQGQQGEHAMLFLCICAQVNFFKKLYI